MAAKSSRCCILKNEKINNTVEIILILIEIILILSEIRLNRRLGRLLFIPYTEGLTYRSELSKRRYAIASKTKRSTMHDSLESLHDEPLRIILSYVSQLRAFFKRHTIVRSGLARPFLGLDKR